MDYVLAYTTRYGPDGPIEGYLRITPMTVDDAAYLANSSLGKERIYFVAHISTN